MGPNRQRLESTCGSDKLMWKIRVGGAEPSWTVQVAVSQRGQGGIQHRTLSKARRGVFHNPYSVCA